VQRTKYYVVAATPRTGSSLLCEGLTATGIAGRPAEVFAPDFREPWYKLWGLSKETDFRQYVRCALEYGTTSNGVYGMKIQWMHIEVFARDLRMSRESDVLQHLFPDGLFLNIMRRDRRAQALSWYRAIVTGEWFRHRGACVAPASVPPAPHPSLVVGLEREIARQQGAWGHYFRNRGVHPVTVEYENLVRDYRSEIARVLRHLELDEGVARSIPEPRLMRQSDDETYRWRALLESTPADDSRTWR
jgi:trehalose 2-sulfotransferase